MYLQYQDKTLRIVPTGAVTIQNFHLGQKYAITHKIHNILRGDVTTNTDDNVIITHSKN